MLKKEEGEKINVMYGENKSFFKNHM